jgi:hypothetical protein
MIGLAAGKDLVLARLFAPRARQGGCLCEDVFGVLIETSLIRPAKTLPPCMAQY